MRAGATPEVVAAESGWPLDKVQRYADPPLAERAFIAQQAQAVTLLGGSTPSTLAEIAGQTIAALGLESLEWDAFRREADGRWVLTAVVPGSDQLATWSYDPAGRNVHPQNTFARVLMGMAEPAATQETVVANEPAHPSQREDRPHLIAVPTPEDVHPRADTLTLDVPEPVQQEPKRRSKSKRASVPSWDEILFGTQRGDDG